MNNLLTNNWTTFMIPFENVYTIPNMIFNETFDFHQVCILTNDGLNVNAHLNNWPIFHVFFFFIYDVLKNHTNQYVYANKAWGFKTLKPSSAPFQSWPLTEKISITLKKNQTTSILYQGIALGLATSQLPPIYIYISILWFTAIVASIPQKNPP